MKADCTWRWGVLAVVLATSLVLAGCSGGGSGSTSSYGGITPGAPAGPASVEISLNTASATGSTAAPVRVDGAATVPTADPAFLWPQHVTDPKPEIAHVYMDVVKVSLMPAEEVSEGEDMDGELGDEDNSPDSKCPVKPHFVTIVPASPITIDLLKMENGKRLARFLNRFDQVPAGTYDKIRVYYENVKVVLSDGSKLRFHATAHSKFDIHFRNGHELVIPATTDSTQPDGWVKFFRVKIDVVGLKLQIKPGWGHWKHWKGCKVILRPQIFAEFVSPTLYSVAGTADKVSSASTPPVSGTFDVSFGTGFGYPRVIHAAFDNDTAWAYGDNVLAGSSWIVGVDNNAVAVMAFKNRAVVDVVGQFDPFKVFQASDIVFTFPDVRTGVVDNGWKSDNTFVLRLPAGNVVFPMPDRLAAYYDNAAAPHDPLTDLAIDNNVAVKARGYSVTDGIDAYWITVGP